MKPNLPPPPTAARCIAEYYADQSRAGRPVDDLLTLAERFVRMKQRLGHRYQANRRSLDVFLRFLAERGVHRASALSLGAVLAWNAHQARLHPFAQIIEASAVGVFLEHLHALGKTVVPLSGYLHRPRRPHFQPRIFSPDELRRIFRCADTRGGAPNRGLIYRVIYGCGLRVSEAAHLAVQDLDLNRGAIEIHKAKFNKERLLPLHPRMVEFLRCYRNEHRADVAPADPFFVLANGRGFSPGRLGGVFRTDIVRLGLYRPTRDADGVRYGSPRIHSLRHSFAVHRLLRWYRSGADVQAKLPLLSTYMGHSAISCTQVYLSITGMVLREAHARFAARWEKEFPLQP